MVKQGGCAIILPLRKWPRSKEVENERAIAVEIVLVE